MKKEIESDVIGVIEVKKENILEDWGELNKIYIDDEIKELKKMTDSQLRNRAKEEKIPNYQSLNVEELLNELIKNVKKEVEEAYLYSEKD